MDTIPLHPKLVHLPIALAVLMPLLTGGLLLAWWRGWLPKKTWVLPAAAQLLLVASGLLAMRSGESDEERVERIVPGRAIDAHEETAEAFVWGSGIVFALVLLPLVLRSPRPARTAALGAVAGTLVVLFLGFRAGQSGGELVYRHGAATAFVTNHAAEPPRPSARVDDDDR
jgi:uncharacterized membrane protein